MFSSSQRYHVRSRGIANDARVKLAGGDIGWADVIFVMEKNHKDRIAKRFREETRSKRIVCLFIEDIYEPMESALIAELRRKLSPYLILPEEKPANQRVDNVGSRAPKSGRIVR